MNLMPSVYFTHNPLCCKYLQNSESLPFTIWRFNTCFTIIVSNSTLVIILADSTVHIDDYSNTMAFQFLDLCFSIIFVLNPTSATYSHNTFLEFIASNCKSGIISILNLLPCHYQHLSLQRLSSIIVPFPPFSCSILYLASQST